MRSWIACFCAVFEREIKGICASPQLVVFCFYLPVFWIFFVWLLLGQGIIARLPVAVIDNDNSPLSRAIIRAADACPSFSPRTFLEPESALNAMRAGKIYDVMLIPAGYAREKQSGSGSSIVLWLDQNRFAAAGMLQSQLASALQSFVDADLLKIALSTGNWFAL